MAVLSGLPPLPLQPLQALWRYLGLTDQGAPEALPVPSGYAKDGDGDLLTWNYTQPTGENARRADGFVLYADVIATADPSATALLLAPDVLSFRTLWAPSTTRSYAVAACRFTHGGLAIGPKQQLAAWNGAT